MNSVLPKFLVTGSSPVTCGIGPIPVGAQHPASPKRYAEASAAPFINTAPPSTSLNAIRFDGDGITAHIDATAFQRHILANQQFMTASPLQRKVFHESLMAKGIVAFGETCVLTEKFSNFLDGITGLDHRTLNFIADHITPNSTPKNLNRQEMMTWVVQEASRNERVYELLFVIAVTFFENDNVKEMIDSLSRYQPQLQKQYSTRMPPNLRNNYQLNLETNLTHRDQLLLTPGRLTRSGNFMPQEDVELLFLGSPITFMKNQLIELHENGMVKNGTLAKNVFFRFRKISISLDALSTPYFHDNGMLRSWNSYENPYQSRHELGLGFQSLRDISLHPSGTICQGLVTSPTLFKTENGFWLTVYEGQYVHLNQKGELERPYPYYVRDSILSNLTHPVGWLKRRLKDRLHIGKNPYLDNK